MEGEEAAKKSFKDRVNGKSASGLQALVTMQEWQLQTAREALEAQRRQEKLRKERELGKWSTIAVRHPTPPPEHQASLLQEVGLAAGSAAVLAPWHGGPLPPGHSPGHKNKKKGKRGPNSSSKSSPSSSPGGPNLTKGSWYKAWSEKAQEWIWRQA